MVPVIANKTKWEKPTNSTNILLGGVDFEGIHQLLGEPGKMIHPSKVTNHYLLNIYGLLQGAIEVGMSITFRFLYFWSNVMFLCHTFCCIIPRYSTMHIVLSQSVFSSSCSISRFQLSHPHLPFPDCSVLGFDKSPSFALSSHICFSQEVRRVDIQFILAFWDTCALC